MPLNKDLQNIAFLKIRSVFDFSLIFYNLILNTFYLLNISILKRFLINNIYRIIKKIFNIIKQKIIFW